jgi:hypothetical protein
MGVAAPCAQARLGHKKGPIPAKRKARVKGLRAKEKPGGGLFERIRAF